MGQKNRGPRGNGGLEKAERANNSNLHHDTVRVNSTKARAKAQDEATFDGGPISRLEFLGALVRVGIRGAELAVSVVLARRFNTKRQVAWPSLNTIAAESGYRISSVCRALSNLQSMGLIGIMSRGGPRSGSTRYTLNFRTALEASTGTHMGGSTCADTSTPIEASTPTDERTVTHERKYSQGGEEVLPPAGDEPSSINPGKTRELMEEDALRAAAAAPVGAATASGEEEEEERPAQDAEALLKIALDSLNPKSSPRLAKKKISVLITDGAQIEDLHAALDEYLDCCRARERGYLKMAESFFEPGVWDDANNWGLRQNELRQQEKSPQPPTVAAKTTAHIVGPNWSELELIFIADPKNCLTCQEENDGCPASEKCRFEAFDIADDGAPMIDPDRCNLCLRCTCPSKTREVKLPFTVGLDRKISSDCTRTEFFTALEELREAMGKPEASFLIHALGLSGDFAVHCKAWRDDTPFPFREQESRAVELIVARTGFPTPSFVG